MTAAISPQKRTRLAKLVQQKGYSVKGAAEQVGIGYTTARQIMYDLAQNQAEREAEKKAEGLGGPLRYDELSPPAQQAWDDFEFFRRRYFGHLSRPWQVDAAHTIIASLDSANRDFGVMNVSPGTGKTTLMHDIAAWITVRNRSIRGLMGSATQRKAEKMLGRLRRNLERTTPAKAEDDMLRLGLACDAEATLAADFGIFRPLDRTEPWRSDALMVVQYDFDLVTEKEHTWTAYGLDVDYLGDRVTLALWDDATVPQDLTTLEKIESKRKNFDTIAESRIEPGGALWLVGQRIGANDLYRHALDKVTLPDDDDELDALESMSEDERTAAYDGMGRKYRHVIYPAHDDKRCLNQHKTTAPAWPDGCLLDPVRVPWRELRSLRHQDAGTFAVWYQQEDTDIKDSLVRKVWVTGGTDPDTHVQHYGCWDNDRHLNELPANLVGPKFCFATIDPSPTRFWAIQKWCVAKGQRVLTERGEVPIEQVQMADRVRTRGGWRHIQHVTHMGVRPVLEIGLSSGRVLRVTDDHRLLLADGRWVEAGRLTLGATLCDPTVTSGVRAGAADRGAVFADQRVLPRDLMSMTAVSPSVPDVGRTDHVRPMADQVEMVGVDARRVPTEMVEFPDWQRLAAMTEKSIRESMSKAFPGSGTDAPVPVAVTASLPLPASGGRDYDPRLNPRLVHPSPTTLVQHPIAAWNASLRPPTHSRSAVATHPHVVSIRQGERPSDVFDIGVYGEHEFTVEGVIVHNCYAPQAENQIFLMDLVKAKLTADQVLDWRHQEGEFYGIMEDWQAQSVKEGLPISTWVIERAGAQRFLLQYDHVRRWLRHWGTQILPHDTNSNKNDPDYGVYVLREWWRTGRVRLPGKGDTARLTSLKLVDEVQRYPHGYTDDQVMAMWFLILHLPHLAVTSDTESRPNRPSFLNHMPDARRLMAVS